MTRLRTTSKTVPTKSEIPAEISKQHQATICKEIIMIYPTIKDLTKGEFNRYEIALATAKCARMITN